MEIPSKWPQWIRFTVLLIASFALLTGIGCEVSTGGGLNVVSLPQVSAQCSLGTMNCPHTGNQTTRSLIILFTTVANCVDEEVSSGSSVKARGTGTWTCGPGVCQGSIASFSPSSLTRRAYRICAIVDVSNDGVANSGDVTGFTTVDYRSDDPTAISILTDWESY